MTKLEQVYGGALYDLAREEGLEEEIGRELRQVLGLLDENPAYLKFLGTLSIAKAERCAALDEAFGGRVEPYLLNFMKILCENGTIGHLKGCAQEYRRRYNADKGIVEVRAVTAVPMSERLRDKLRAKLETTMGKTVELQCCVDPACIGGVRLELPGRQLDGTVKHRLEDLGRTLQSVTM